jgi:hypothetical protein
MYPSRKVAGILSLLLSLAVFCPGRLAAESLTIAWDSNPEGELGGYKIYYGTQSGNYDFFKDVGDVTRKKIRRLKPETRYYFALTAYDVFGNESDFSAEVSAITEAASGSPTLVLTGTDDGYSEWGCFIATAAYGSYFSPHVKILRDFRDEYLISNVLGRKFVHLYYQHGPRIANRIGEHGFLRFLTRQALLPLVWLSSFSLKTTASPILLLLPFCLLSIFTIALHSCHRRRQVR